jgi:hypothetical protein
MSYRATAREIRGILTATGDDGRRRADVESDKPPSSGRAKHEGPLSLAAPLSGIGESLSGSDATPKAKS